MELLQPQSTINFPATSFGAIFGAQINPLKEAKQHFGLHDSQICCSRSAPSALAYFEWSLSPLVSNLLSDYLPKTNLTAFVYFPDFIVFVHKKQKVLLPAGVGSKPVTERIRFREKHMISNVL